MTDIVADGYGIATKRVHRSFRMDYVISPSGLLVHSRRDWPCAGCRPRDISDGRAFCLCVKCAHGVITAAEAGFEGMRALLDEITDALVLLEGQRAALSVPFN